MSERGGAGFGARTLWLALAVGVPGTATALALLWLGDYSAKVRWTLSSVAAGGWLALAFLLRAHVVRPLQTLANLVASLREGDFSQRARPPRDDDELGLIYTELNRVGEALRSQRLGAIEASALLRQVMAEIDVAVLAFDDDGRLQLSNRAGERLLGRPARELVGVPAAELGLADALTGKTPRTIELHGARWELTRTPIRQGGVPHDLVVLSNVQRALREQERQAWKRLIRVLSHEINNSLAPIQSIAGSLRNAPEPDDLARGLAIIEGRAEALSRFMQSYARLARLPSPKLAPVEVATWIRRVAELESRLQIRVADGPAVTISGDSDQLDQLLINLVQNAVDAALEAGGDHVEVTWRLHDSRLEVLIEDDGPGIADTANLFVPFFTTKPTGSGIGLALSRQIAEAHDGTITLENRPHTRGALARISLPHG